MSKQAKNKKTSAPTSPSQLPVEQLRKDVEDLKRRLDNENKGFSGRVKRWGTVLAFIAAIFAVPHGVLDLVKSFREIRSAPDIKAFAGWPLEMALDGKERQVDFTFNFTLANYGAKDDLIIDAKASIDSVSDSSPIPLDITTLHQNNAEVRIPFPIGTSSPKEIICSISSRLGELGWESFLEPGLHRLNLEFKSQNGETYALNFCFWLTDMAKALLEGTQYNNFIEQDPRCQIGK